MQGDHILISGWNDIKMAPQGVLFVPLGDPGAVLVKERAPYHSAFYIIYYIVSDSYYSSLFVAFAVEKMKRAAARKDEVKGDEEGIY
ncbi:hypothetical protein ABER99_03250 [Paenibacillus glucanolyticus]|nr:hypothetical protein [Paenibacillus glucanolyticus]